MAVPPQPVPGDVPEEAPNGEGALVESPLPVPVVDPLHTIPEHIPIALAGEGPLWTYTFTLSIRGAPDAWNHLGPVTKVMTEPAFNEMRDELCRRDADLVEITRVPYHDPEIVP